LNPTQNDLPEPSRKKLVELLNARLADATDLMLQAKQAHWNVKGPSFIALHELFDQVNSATAEHVDLIAERAVQLGGVVYGTARVAAERSHLEEYPLEITAGSDHAMALSAALSGFGKALRKAIHEADELGDADTADVLTEVSRTNDKLLWFVEAHLQS
jgi:starvation-inducible DNA-binding protein